MRTSIATAVLFIFLAISGCGTLDHNVAYEQSVGNHFSPGPKVKNAKSVVVWSNDSVVESVLIGMLQSAGLVVVERVRLQQVFKEQQVRLTHTSDDDADLLRVGKLIGADRVVFAEVKSKEHLSVGVRGVDVETGAIRWSGMAYYNVATSTTEHGLVNLTVTVMFRAICPVEAGYVWINPSSEPMETSFCTKNGKMKRLSEMKEDLAAIW